MKVHVDFNAYNEIDDYVICAVVKRLCWRRISANLKREEKERVEIFVSIV